MALTEEHVNITVHGFDEFILTRPSVRGTGGVNYEFNTPLPNKRIPMEKMFDFERYGYSKDDLITDDDFVEKKRNMNDPWRFIE